MNYDEDENGEIVDRQYLRDGPIARYKLVCENDVDTGSLPEQDRHILDDYIEMGLEAKSRAEVFKEVQSLLNEYKIRSEGRAPQDNFAILLRRIISLSGPQGRPLAVVIDEHLVGTASDDPAILRMSDSDNATKKL